MTYKVNPKKETPTQEARRHTKEIQASIKKHLDDLDEFCRCQCFSVYVPALYANDAEHTAEMTWGIDMDDSAANKFTELFNSIYKYPRLTVSFIGRRSE